MNEKLLKDPVHGYIVLDNEFVELIDTAAFQRLKRLEQTSYRVLYPGARHDRFIHSVGVYHLGCLVFDSICANFHRNDCEKEWELIKKLKYPFLLACLLHDIGHSPFSHTLELFYDKDSVVSEIKQKIKNSNISLNPAAAYHELMSANLVLTSDEIRNRVNTILQKADTIPEEEALEFICRAITGSVYRNNVTTEDQIMNSFVRLLNSELIDIDRLDYIIRDAQTSGYKNVEMDLPRLISAISIEKNSAKGNYFWPVYKKSAISIIRNVFNARNNEIRWIQSHNAVVYETWLIRRALHRIMHEKLDDAALFSKNSLTSCGTEIMCNNGTAKRRITYLADEDILSLLKEYCDDISEAREYLDRNYRRKAIWKSHDEYTAVWKSVGNSVEFYASFQKYFVDQRTVDDDEKPFRDLDSKELVSFKNELWKEWEPDLLFLTYQPKFSDDIEADEIFISFPTGYHAFSEFNVSKQIESSKDDIQLTSDNTQGFYIYERRDDSKKTEVKVFLEAYKRHIAPAKFGSTPH